MLNEHKGLLDAYQKVAGRDDATALERKLGREIQAIIKNFDLSFIAYHEIFTPGSAPVRM